MDNLIRDDLSIVLLVVRKEVQRAIFNVDVHLADASSDLLIMASSGVIIGWDDPV